MDRETPRAKDESAVIRGLKRSARMLEGVRIPIPAIFLRAATYNLGRDSSHKTCGLQS